MEYQQEGGERHDFPEYEENHHIACKHDQQHGKDEEVCQGCLKVFSCFTFCVFRVFQGID